MGSNAQQNLTKTNVKRIFKNGGGPKKYRIEVRDDDFTIWYRTEEDATSGRNALIVNALV